MSEINPQVGELWERTYRGGGGSVIVIILERRSFKEFLCLVVYNYAWVEQTHKYHIWLIIDEWSLDTWNKISK